MLTNVVSNHQRQADAIHAHQIIDFERADPGDREQVLHLRLADCEAGRVGLRMPAAPTGAGRIIQTVIANTDRLMNSENRFTASGLILGEKRQGQAPKAGRNTTNVNGTT